MNGVYKPLVEVGGRPMISYSLEALRPSVDELLVVVRGSDRAAELSRAVVPSVRVVEEPDSAPRAPLTGLVWGARSARGSAILVAPADTPFLPPEVYERLASELAADVDAAVPVWPNGYIEPLVAAYRRRPLIEAAGEVAAGGELRISSVLSRMRVRLVPVEALSDDPRVTFLNVNTFEDLSLARRILVRLRARRT